MMYLVTVENVGLKGAGLRVCSNFAQLLNDVTVADDVVYHSADTPAMDTIGALTQLAEMGVSLYGIGYSDILAVQVIKANKGIIYEDETAIYDVDILKYVTDISARDELLALYNVDKELQVVSHYANLILDALKSGSDTSRLETLRNDVYLKSFCEASLVVVDNAKKTEDSNAQHQLELVRFIGDILTRVRSWADAKRDIEDECKRLTKEVTAFKQKTNGDESRISTYPAYNVSSSVSCKVLYVKEYTPCSYLTSLLACYVRYLQNKKGMSRARMVIIHNNSMVLKSKYAAAFSNINPVIAQRGVLDGTLYSTCEPTKDVMDLLTSKSDVLIVLERLQRTGAMVTGRNVTTFNAFSSLRDIRMFVKEYKIPMASVIQGIGVAEALADTVCIPKIVGYISSSEMQRESFYFKTCGQSIFEQRFNRSLGIK